MPNRSYLCATNLRLTYPSSEDPNFSGAADLIANDVRHVPLLWLAMFRADDIVRRTVRTQTERALVLDLRTMQNTVEEPEDVEFETEAPLVSVVRAIEQLQGAIPYFNAVFEAEGKLDEYAAFLIETLRFVTKFVTIELEEIAEMTGADDYFALIRAALTDIGSAPTPEAKARLIEIAGLDRLDRFPPANLALMDHAGGDPKDAEIHARVLGAGAKGSGLGRAVPWEREPTQFGYRPNAKGLVPLFFPKLDVLFARHEADRGAALTKAEAIAIRTDAVCMMLPSAEAARHPHQGPPDLDPENCWEEWNERKAVRDRAKA